MHKNKIASHTCKIDTHHKQQTTSVGKDVGKKELHSLLVERLLDLAFWKNNIKLPFMPQN